MKKILLVGMVLGFFACAEEVDETKETPNEEVSPFEDDGPYLDGIEEAIDYELEFVDSIEYDLLSYADSFQNIELVSRHTTYEDMSRFIPLSGEIGNTMQLIVESSYFGDDILYYQSSLLIKPEELFEDEPTIDLDTLRCSLTIGEQVYLMPELLDTKLHYNWGLNSSYLLRTDQGEVRVFNFVQMEQVFVDYYVERVIVPVFGDKKPIHVGSVHMNYDG